MFSMSSKPMNAKNVSTAPDISIPGASPVDTAVAAGVSR
jgi:hypothetical protein